MFEENEDFNNSENENLFDFNSNKSESLEVESDIPDQLSPEWHDYVMSQFTEFELVEINGEKYPNCYGLRRVVEQLVGRIVESRPVNLILSSDSTGGVPGRATCIYEVVIRDYDTGQLKKYGDVAEVFSLNCDDLFLAYPAATAVTRAEGRCLRKLLKVRCVAAEELTRSKNVGEAVKAVVASSPISGAYEAESPISGAQIKAIERISNVLKIDIMKFINSYEKGKNYNKLEDVTKKTGIGMIGLLNDYQNNKRPIPIDIMV